MPDLRWSIKEKAAKSGCHDVWAVDTQLRIAVGCKGGRGPNAALSPCAIVTKNSRHGCPGDGRRTMGSSTMTDTNGS